MSIEIVGTAAGAQADLLRRLGLAPGAPYRREALNARIDRYIADRRKAGYYEARLAIAAALTDEDRLANLTLTVTPGPHVRVVFTGDPLPADKRAELVPIEREGSVDEDLLEDSTNRIEEYLRSQGYRDATAPHTRTSPERRAGDHLRREARARSTGSIGSRSPATPRCRWPSSRPRCACATASRSRQPGSTRTWRRSRTSIAGAGSPPPRCRRRKSRNAVDRRRAVRPACASAWSSPKGCGRWCPRCAFQGNEAVSEADVETGARRCSRAGRTCVPSWPLDRDAIQLRLPQSRLRERHRRRQAEVQRRSNRAPSRSSPSAKGRRCSSTTC